MNFVAALTRKKPSEDDGPSQLARVLTVVDLTGLGVGSTLGLGVYVLAGSVAKDVAGPAVTISFLVAAIASAVAGLCYAEFAARVPKAGSAYVYSYVTVGELVAFTIGWNLILEYVIGTASVARGLSNYVDAMVNHSMSAQMREWVPMNVSFLSEYPDILAFCMVLVLAALLAFGVKESSTFNNIFTTLNLLTVVTVLVAGSFKIDIKNWQIDPEEIPPNVDGGSGGFMPFGVAGIMAGAAKCFYGFVGFDCIATTGEEAKNPQRSIPLAIVLSLLIIFFAYFGISSVLTLMWPYYDQDANAPFPHVFEQVGWPTIKTIVTIGAIFALCTSLLGAMFPLPRVIYAMSNDGIVFKSLAKVHPKTQTPLVATILSGLFAGTMAALFNLQQLIDMMSIGTLLAYTIVAMSVLVLRYEHNETYQFPKGDDSFQSGIFQDARSLFNLNMNKYPSRESSSITKWGICIFSVLAILICMGSKLVTTEEPLSLAAYVAVWLCAILTVVIIGRQPVSDESLSFKVPFVPVIPCASVVINVYLMLELDAGTWARFAIWMVLGFLMYFLYGIRHSVNSAKNRGGGSNAKNEVTKF